MRAADRTLAFLALFPLGALVAGVAPAEAQWGGNVFKHPSGFMAQLPSGWQAQTTEQGIFLVPPDMATDANGQPLEIFMIGYEEDVEGISDPGAPEVVQYFQQGLPGLRPAGSPQRLGTGLGLGAVLTFSGFMGGSQVRQRTYVTLYEGTGIYLAHLAAANLAPRRDAALQGVFQSFSWGEPEADLAVLGTWYRESTTESGDFYSTLMEWYQFAEGGQMAYTWKRSTSVGIGEPQTLAGRWQAVAGELEVELDNGDAWAFSYALTQNSEGTPVLKLVGGSGEVQWFYFQGR